MDYKNGKIYRLVSNVSGEQYIGSTTQPLYKRLSYHKKNYKCWKQGKRRDYTTSFKLIETGDVEIILIEDYPCERKEQLHSRERYWIENVEGGCVNKCIPTRTHKEYYEENRQKWKEYAKEYHKQNKEKINEKKREYAKEYREQNKEKIKEYEKEVIKCVCGSEICRGKKARHEKTQKHLSWLNKNES